MNHGIISEYHWAHSSTNTQCLILYKIQKWWYVIVNVYQTWKDSTAVKKKKFYNPSVTLNGFGHPPTTNLDSEEIMWVHAIRFWSVVGRFVMSSKSKEYNIRENTNQQLHERNTSYNNLRNHWPITAYRLSFILISYKPMINYGIKVFY